MSLGFWLRALKKQGHGGIANKFIHLAPVVGDNPMRDLKIARNGRLGAISVYGRKNIQESLALQLALPKDYRAQLGKAPDVGKENRRDLRKPPPSLIYQVVKFVLAGRHGARRRFWHVLYSGHRQPVPSPNLSVKGVVVRVARYPCHFLSLDIGESPF